MPQNPDSRIETTDLCCPRLSSRWRTRVLVSVLTAFAGVSPVLLAQPKKPAPAVAAVPTPSPAASSRFLFVVNTSAAMKRQIPDVVNIAEDILRSGASGQLHPGNTIGMWTFNADVYTGNLPLQTWAQEDAEEIALRTAEFLRQQHYEKASRFDLAMSGVCEIAKHSDILTAFIISDGSGQMEGTPFDGEINALYRQNLADMKKNRRPIVTVLQSKAGHFTRFTVNAVPWPVVIPEVPIPIKTTESSLVKNPAPAAPIQTPAPTGLPKPTTTPAPPTAQPPPALATRPTPTPTATLPPPTTVPAPAQPPTTPALVTTPKAPPAVAPPAIQTTPTPTIVRPIPTPETMPRPAEAPPISGQPPVIAAVTPKTTPNNAPPPLAAPPVATPNPTSVGQAQVATPPALQKAPPGVAPRATNSAPAPVVAAAAPASAGRPKSLLLAGLGLLAVGFGLIIVLIMRSRRASNTSLITDVMGGPRK